jgi:hypothetical protein
MPVSSLKWMPALTRISNNMFFSFLFVLGCKVKWRKGYGLLMFKNGKLCGAFLLFDKNPLKL